MPQSEPEVTVNQEVVSKKPVVSAFLGIKEDETVDSVDAYQTFERALTKDHWPPHWRNFKGFLEGVPERIEHINVVNMLVMLGLTKQLRQLKDNLQWKIEDGPHKRTHNFEYSFYRWVEADNFFSLYSAAKAGHLSMVTLVVDGLTDQKVPLKIMESAARAAASEGHMETMLYLITVIKESYLTPDAKRYWPFDQDKYASNLQFQASAWFSCFGTAIENGHDEICHYFVGLGVLSLLEVLARDYERYGERFLKPYFDAIFLDLNKRKEAHDQCLETTSLTLWKAPQLEMQYEEALVGHLMAQCLIKQAGKTEDGSEAQALLKLKLLMRISDIKRLSAYNNNELLFTALSSMNMLIAEYLLGLPEVRHLIRYYDLYSPHLDSHYRPGYRMQDTWNLISPLLKTDSEFSDRVDEINKMEPVKPEKRECLGHSRMF